jgi:ABC-type branched-subunit amino acid transport system permease subunit
VPVARYKLAVFALAAVFAGFAGGFTPSFNTVGTQPGMPPYASPVLSYAVYAVLLVAVLLFLPRGLLPMGTEWLRRALRLGAAQKATQRAPLARS